MNRTAIRVEPFSTYLERRRKGPVFPVIVADDLVFVSGLPPFDETGEIRRLPFERQAEIVLDQMKRCLEAAGSSMERVIASRSGARTSKPCGGSTTTTSGRCRPRTPAVSRKSWRRIS